MAIKPETIVARSKNAGGGMWTNATIIFNQRESQDQQAAVIVLKLKV